MLAHDFFRAISLDTFRSRVPAGHSPLRIEHENRIIPHTLGEQAEALLTLAESLLSLLAVSDVTDHRQYPRASRCFQRTKHDIHGKLAAVFPLAKQVQACTHGPHAQLLTVALAV